MMTIDPARFTELADELRIADAALGVAHVALDLAREDCRKTAMWQSAARAALRQYIETAAGARIA